MDIVLLPFQGEGTNVYPHRGVTSGYKKQGFQPKTVSSFKQREFGIKNNSL